MERILRESGLDRTSGRPPRLTNSPGTGAYRDAVEAGPVGSTVTRADVARAMLDYATELTRTGPGNGPEPEETRMTTRVTLIAPAIGPALREARFVGSDDAVDDDGDGGGGKGDEGLDATGVRLAEAARADAWDTCLPHAPDPAGRLHVSPTRRCRRTAEALGIDAEPLAVLAPCATGRWQGRTLNEVAAAEPESVGTWLSDPASAPHGGETLAALCLRVGAWLDGLAAEAAGRVVAVAEPDVVRAAAVHALGAEPQAFWRLDVRPLSVTELSGRNGRWNLLSGRPLRGTAP